ncbi:hypothetical protein DENSPDRAFT_842034 [Dentipellis sp. KUC8613]|nr:hypothetical protein DENSPDRAFT_842034 [Dentipellis sp. KUC8613]
MSPAASKSPSPSPDAGAVAANAEKAPETPAAPAPVVEADDEREDSASASPKASPEQSTASDAAPVASSSTSPAPTAGSLTAGDWQAIWSPSHNAYYFFNAATQQTTWENPLQPTAGPSSSSASPADASSAQTPAGAAPPAIASMYALQEAAAAQGIDPSLAYLDPSLAGQAGPSGAYAYSAKFNARTGAFAKPDGRDPTHLSEYERAKRMSEVYFDVGAWEKEVEARKEEEEQNGKKRKRPTKKDLERFKEQKRLKKIAKTAWLRT